LDELKVRSRAEAERNLTREIRHLEDEILSEFPGNGRPRGECDECGAPCAYCDRDSPKEAEDWAESTAATSKARMALDELKECREELRQLRLNRRLWPDVALQVAP
jgi:hypothetical protein